MTLNDTIATMLEPGEQMLAHVIGRSEQLQGPLFSSRGLLIATDRRILSCLKVEQSQLEKRKSVWEIDAVISYNQIAKVREYTDFFNGSLGLCKTLHLQTNNGDLFRLIAPEGGKEFVNVAQAKMIS